MSEYLKLSKYENNEDNNDNSDGESIVDDNNNITTEMELV